MSNNTEQHKNKLIYQNSISIIFSKMKKAAGVISVSQIDY